MVRAIREGRKTQTRRIAKHQHWSYSELHDVNKEGILQKVDRNVSCPHGEVGDKLWVKETHGYSEGTVIMTSDDRRPVGSKLSMVSYRADLGEDAACPVAKKWRPSIFMPRALSRITLEITGVRVERLNDISEADVVAEGVKTSTGVGMIEGETVYHYTRSSGYSRGLIGARGAYMDLWESINGPGSWDANPYVWVIEFKHLTP